MNTRVNLFGHELPFPIRVAPTGSHRRSHPNGVKRVINILRSEMEMTMASLGRSDLASIDRTVFWDRRA